MDLFLLGVLLALFRAIIITQAIIASDHRDVPHMIGGMERRGRSAVMILVKSENRKYIEEKYQYECAGTIISKTHILTSAQCLCSVINEDCGPNLKIGDIKVAAGENDMAELYDSNMELINSGEASMHAVKRIITHPDYSYTDYKWDIALLELKTSIIFNDNIEAARLPPPGMMYTKEWVKIGGWGIATESDGLDSRNVEPAQKHRIIEADMKSEDECTDIFSSFNFSPDLQFCAKQKHFRCKGDKGDNGARVAGAGILFTQWQYPIVIGIVSGSDNSGCSVFSTKTEEALSWIDMEANIRPTHDVFNVNRFRKYINEMPYHDLEKIIEPMFPVIVKVDSGWSSWTEWTSTGCGRTRERTCDYHSGSNCLGDATQKEDCQKGAALEKDCLGVHMGAKYKDAAQPLKGGKISFKVDDLKKIFYGDHSIEVEVDVEFDGGVDMNDGLFKMVTNYSIVHSNGDGEEKGQVVIERKQIGNMWATTIKSTASPFSGKPLIHAAINNIEIMVESDSETELHIEFVNPTKNMHINIDRLQGQGLHLQIVNGARKHDLTFKWGDIDLKSMDGIFNIGLEGTSLGEAIKGKLAGSTKEDIQNVRFELEKDNKKFIQIDTKIKMDVENQYFESRTKYAVLGGTFAGKVLLKYENKVFTVKHTDSLTKETLELTIKSDESKTDYIEAKKNGESLWTYKIKYTTVSYGTKFEVFKLTAPNMVPKGEVQLLKMTWSTENINNANEFKFILRNTLEVNPESILFKNIINQYKILTPFNFIIEEFEIYINKKEKNFMLNKFFVMGNVMKDENKIFDVLLSTIENPYKFEVFAPSLLGKLKPGMTEAKISAAHNPGQSLEIKTNFEKFTGLKIYKSDSGNEHFRYGICFG